MQTDPTKVEGIHSLFLSKLKFRGGQLDANALQDLRRELTMKRPDIDDMLFDQAWTDLEARGLVVRRASHAGLTIEIVSGPATTAVIETRGKTVPVEGTQAPNPT